jgi:hypothetical protein
LMLRVALDVASTRIIRAIPISATQLVRTAESKKRSV